MLIYKGNIQRYNDLQHLPSWQSYCSYYLPTTTLLLSNKQWERFSPNTLYQLQQRDNTPTLNRAARNIFQGTSLLYSQTKVYLLTVLHILFTVWGALFIFFLGNQFACLSRLKRKLLCHRLREVACIACCSPHNLAACSIGRGKKGFDGNSISTHHVVYTAVSFTDLTTAKEKK